MAANKLAPPPPGFELDPPSAGGSAPPPPPGFQLDKPETESGSAPPSVSGFGSNVLKSAGNFAGNVASAVSSPYQTVKNIGAVALGAMEKPVRNVGEWATGKPIQHTKEEDMVDAIGQSYKDRYGSFGKAAHTAYTDPVGVAADVSMVAGGAGAGLKAAGMGGRLAEGLGTVSRYTNPITPVASGIKKIVPNPELLKNYAERNYQGALKPVTSIPRPDVSAMVKKGLDEGIPVSKKGLEQTRGKIDTINDTVDTAIQDAKAAGKTVDPGPVAAETNRSMKAFKTGMPQDQAPIVKMRDEFLKENPNPIPIDEAQSMKRANYRINRESAYGEQVGAVREARKDIARGLKDAVYAQLPPEISSLGPHEKVLIDLEKSLERYANRHGNRDAMGIGTPIAAGAAHAATGSGVAAGMAGLVKAVWDYPPFKSRLAIAVNRAAQKAQSAPSLPPTNLRLPINAAGRFNATQPRQQSPDEQ